MQKKQNKITQHQNTKYTKMKNKITKYSRYATIVFFVFIQ